MADIGIGILGGGYMGKAHSAAISAVGAVFDTPLRPCLEMICASSPKTAEQYRSAYGFRRATSDWQEMVRDPAVQAIIIAAPPALHHSVTMAAISAGKPVFCEKPMGQNLQESQSMVDAVEGANLPNMVGYNYIRTPASQHARHLIKSGVIGDVTFFRGEHTEDFLADPQAPVCWRTSGQANGALGDLAPHIINAALALVGPLRSVMADLETVHRKRPGGIVDNDDQLQMMLRFENGASGQLLVSRISHGRKMGYAYEITGTKGAIRFDQEDQNVLWLYRAQGAEAERGFTRILTGPDHPDYAAFCQGAGHGTGYLDQIIIEARDFLEAIHTGASVWPRFRDGLAVMEVIAAGRKSAKENAWVDI